jgi:hypothetical protein
MHRTLGSVARCDRLNPADWRAPVGSLKRLRTRNRLTRTAHTPAGDHAMTDTTTTTRTRKTLTADERAARAARRERRAARRARRMAAIQKRLDERNAQGLHILTGDARREAQAEYERLALVNERQRAYGPSKVTATA